MDELKGLGFDKVRRSHNNDQLSSILKRHESGAVCFEKYSDNELWDKADGHMTYDLFFGGNTLSYANRLRLIERLQEQYDHNRNFRRLLDLPPELRRRVYEFYVADFPFTLKLPAQPPLARTCKILRQEVLPVFYGTLEFEIHIKQGFGDHFYKFHESNKTQLFLTRLAAVDVACIRRLKVVIKRQLGGFMSDKTHETSMICSIDLDSMDGFSTAAEVTVRRGELLKEEWLTARMRDKLRHVILQLVESLQIAEDGKRRFTIQAIHSLRGCVEKALL